MISLEDKENQNNQLWTIDPVNGTLVIALNGGLSKVEISLSEMTGNNG